MEFKKFLAGKDDYSIVDEMINLQTNGGRNPVRYETYVASIVNNTPKLVEKPRDSPSDGDEEVAIAILCGACSNSILPQGSLIGAIRNWRNYVNNRREAYNRTLDRVKSPFDELSMTQKSQIDGGNRIANTAERNYLYLISLSLGRPVKPKDLSGSGLIQGIRVDISEKGEAIKKESLPEHVESFTKTFHGYVDASDDTATSEIIATMDEFSDVVSNGLRSSSGNENFAGWLESMSGLTKYILYVKKPASLSLADRSNWVLNVAEILTQVAKVYFNITMDKRNESILEKLPIRQTDDLDVFSRLLVTTMLKGTTDTTSDPLVDWFAFTDLLRSISKDNEDSGLNLIEMSDIIILYASIYGTSVNRIDDYPNKFPVYLMNRRIDVDMHGYTYAIKASRDSGVNSVRRALRGTASRAYKLRFENNIKTQHSSALARLDPILTFDFGNFIDDEVLSIGKQHVRNRLSRWIRHGDRIDVL
nr:53kDa-protein [Grapevine leafroll-associated virus 13]